MSQGRHREPLSAVREWREPPEIQFPDCSPGPALRAGLPEDRSLRPAAVTFRAHSSGAGESAGQLVTRSGWGRCPTPSSAQTAPQLRVFPPRTLAVSVGLRRPACPAAVRRLFANCPPI